MELIEYFVWNGTSSIFLFFSYKAWDVWLRTFRKMCSTEHSLDLASCFPRVAWCLFNPPMSTCSIMNTHPLDGCCATWTISHVETVVRHGHVQWYVYGRTFIGLGTCTVLVSAKASRLAFSPSNISWPWKVTFSHAPLHYVTYIPEA